MIQLPPVSMDVLNVIVEALDTHTRTHGLAVAGQTFQVAELLQGARQKAIADADAKLKAADGPAASEKAADKT